MGCCGQFSSTWVWPWDAFIVTYLPAFSFVQLSVGSVGFHLDIHVYVCSCRVFGTFQVPAGASADAPLSVFIVLHGRGGNGRQALKMTLQYLPEIAASHIVVAPSGFRKCWNVRSEDSKVVLLFKPHASIHFKCTCMGIFWCRIAVSSLLVFSFAC